MMLPLRRMCARVATQPCLRPLSTAAPSEDPKTMVLCNVDSDGFATVTLNRPEMFNAFSDVVIARCSEIFEALRKENGTVCVVRAWGGAVCEDKARTWQLMCQLLPRRAGAAGAEQWRRSLFCCCTVMM